MNNEFINAVIIHRNAWVLSLPKYAKCRIELYQSEILVILVDNLSNVAILK